MRTARAERLFPVFAISSVRGWLQKSGAGCMAAPAMVEGVPSVVRAATAKEWRVGMSPPTAAWRARPGWACVRTLGRCHGRRSDRADRARPHGSGRRVRPAHLHRRPELARISDRAPPMFWTVMIERATPASRTTATKRIASRKRMLICLAAEHTGGCSRRQTSGHQAYSPFRWGPRSAEMSVSSRCQSARTALCHLRSRQASGGLRRSGPPGEIPGRARREPSRHASNLASRV